MPLAGSSSRPSSRANSRHSRTATAALFPNDTNLDPVLTTKAMLVTVVTPRKVSTRRTATVAATTQSERGTSATSAHGRHRKNVPSLGGIIDLASKGLDVVKASTAVPASLEGAPGGPPQMVVVTRDNPQSTAAAVQVSGLTKDAERKEDEKEPSSSATQTTESKPVGMVVIKREESKAASDTSSQQQKPPLQPPSDPTEEEEAESKEVASNVSVNDSTTKPASVVVIKREDLKEANVGEEKAQGPPMSNAVLVDEKINSSTNKLSASAAMMKRDEPPLVTTDTKLKDLSELPRKDTLPEDDEINEEAEGEILDFVHPLKTEISGEKLKEPPKATMISSVKETATLTGSFVKSLEDKLAETVAAKTAASSQQGDDEASEEESVSPEEAAAVTTGVDPDESDINVEELLRISFQKLLEAGHLLNIPTYSLVLDRKDTEDHMSSWIRLDVMVKPNSLGIILERLERLGVGKNCGTLSVYKCELCKTASPYAHIDEQVEAETEVVATATLQGEVDPKTDAPKEEGKEVDETDEDAEELEKAKQQRLLEEARQEWKNAATRLRIEQVREQIIEQAELSFDFIALLSIASIIAGVGLVTNNAVAIVASMLISPIMGPVLGLTFGTRIRDFPLARLSLFNELIALLGCVVIGVVCGICAAFTASAEDWPTAEMEGRGDPIGLISGIAIAIPSGMGVCLSILGGNTSSLVGVAISASLLPPAVNAGICTIHSILLKTGAVENSGDYSAYDFFEIGVISFALTALNIVCIWASGILMFQIKEVAPTTEKNAFWDRDIKVARKLNQEDKPPPVDLTKIREALKNVLKKSPDEKSEELKEIKFRRTSMPTRLDSPTVGDAFALNPRQHSLGNERLWASAIAEGENEEDENIRYVGLEDMANLLGFNRDEDEFAVDPRANVRRNHSSGRYF